MGDQLSKLYVDQWLSWPRTQRGWGVLTWILKPMSMSWAKAILSSTIISAWRSDQDLRSGKDSDQMELINTINYIHFTGSHFFVLLQHPVYEEKILAKAYPEPCLGSQLACRWDKSYFQYNLESYHVLHLVIINNHSMIVTPMKVLSSSQNSFTIQLPEKVMSSISAWSSDIHVRVSRLNWCKVVYCQRGIDKLQSHSILH